MRNTGKKKQLRYDRRKDANCNNYLDSDGSYVITRDVRRGGHWEKEVVARINPDDYPNGADIILALSDLDYTEDCQEEAINEHTDKVFQKKLGRYDGGDDAQLVYPWEEVACDHSGVDVFALLFPDDEPEEERVIRVREFIAALQPQQQDLFYQHIGMNRSLEELRLEEIERTGREITQQAYSNRWNKILARACAFFGAPKPRKRKKSGE